MRTTALAFTSLVAMAACASNPAPAPIVDARVIAPVAAPENVAAPAPVSPSALPSPEPVAPSAGLTAPEATPAPVAASGRNDFATRYLNPLRAASCPAGTRKTEPDAIEMSAAKVSLSRFGSQKSVGRLDYVGGFHLTSPDKRFGGLSGLEVLDDGGLLAVSDAGDFVWIDLADDGLTPKAARIAGMRDSGGVRLDGKTEADAEGLAIVGGLALVSFERDHRVLAYDIGRCGAAARGAPIVFGEFGRTLPLAFADAGVTVAENSGAEPLALTRDFKLLAGIETKADGAGPLSVRPIEAAPVFDLRIGAGAPDFVGVDVLPVGGAEGGDLRVFSLHRDATPGLTAAIVISETYLERYLDQSRLPARIVSEINERSHYRYRAIQTTRLAELGVVLNIDNFEGIAAQALPDGRVRLFVASDDNFSSSQRTLLMVFETNTADAKAGAAK